MALSRFAREFACFLREHPWRWLVPIALVGGALVWLAYAEAATPDSPFVYRL